MSDKKALTNTEAVDCIEAAVYERLKPLGFRKHGRTLHRFVSGDISQVVDFQIGPAYCGMNDMLWVNIGMRVPECATPEETKTKMKKYYREYECNIRCRLSGARGQKDGAYPLSSSPEKLSEEILSEIGGRVLPFFEKLNSRENILLYRRDFPQEDELKCRILLDEAMIYLHLGDRDNAVRAFEEYYDLQLIEYEDICKNGKKVYPENGISYTIYTADDSHIKYLDELGARLGLFEI